MAWFIRVLVSACCYVLAVSSVSAEDEAGRELRAGLAAASTQNYAEAATHFQLAHRIDPESPLVLYNLGLAEAEIPGRELRAMCWLAAFIAARPNANAKATIVEKIAELKALSRANIARLIALTNEVGNRAPDDRQEYRDLITFRTAALWNQIGNKTKAEELLAILPPGSDYASKLRRAIAGDMVLVDDRVGHKVDNKSSGYRVDYDEPYGAWNRFVAWTQSAMGYREEEDQDRADAWERACSSRALAQPLFADHARHLRSLADDYVDQGEWSASIGLARDMVEATGEVIYVQNSKEYEISRMLESIATPWVALIGLALLLGAYVLCVIALPFIRLGGNGTADPASKRLTMAGGFLLVSIFLGAWAANNMISAAAEFATASGPVVLAGVAFMLLLGGASVLFFLFALLALKSMFVRKSAP